MLAAGSIAAPKETADPPVAGVPGTPPESKNRTSFVRRGGLLGMTPLTKVCLFSSRRRFLGLSDFFALVGPVEDGFADAVHGLLGNEAGAFGAGVEVVEDLLGIALEIQAALADGFDPLDQVVGHLLLALDAADAGG